MKNRAVSVLVLVLTSLMLVSIGAAGLAEEEVIWLWHQNDIWKAPDGMGYKLTQEFNERYEGEIRVEINWLATEQFYRAIQTALGSRTLPDLFAAGRLTLPELLAGDYILPVSEIVSPGWEDRFATGAFAEGLNKQGGEIYSWPDTGLWNRNLLFYNREVLRKAGLDPDSPPKTWAELRDMSAKVTDAGKGQYYGFLLAAQDDGICAIQTLALSADPYMDGGWVVHPLSYFDYSTGQYKFDSEAMKQAIQLLLDMKNDGSIFPGESTMNKARARAFLAEGKAAFVLEPQWFMFVTARDYPDADYGIAPTPVPAEGMVPYSATQFASADWFISKDTEHPKAVGKFIDEVLTSDKYLQANIEGGICLTANREVNARTDLYPWPQFETYVDLTAENIRIAPWIGARNPNAPAALAEFSVTPNPLEMLKRIYAEDGKNLDSTLAEYNAKLSEALTEAIEEVQATGIDVNLEDFIFPNWDPSKDYTEEDYREHLGE